MVSFRVLVSASLVVWGTALVAQPFRAADSVVGPLALQEKITTNAGVYTKKQADGAKAQYDKICADCHPFTVAAKKKVKDVPLGEDPFFENWTGRPLEEMVTTIALTMPNDGSATVTEEEALGLVAYILQQNGYPAGAAPLTKATASAIVERPKK